MLALHTSLSLAITSNVDVESYQRENENATGCIVNYSWTAPTYNVDMVNIVYFLVVFNNTAQRVPTTEKNVYSMEQPVCTCASHDITIIAVDQCGQTGPARIHVVRSVSKATCEISTDDHTDPFSFG